MPGYEVVENVTVRDAVPAHLWRRDDVLRPFGFFRLVRAVVPAWPVISPMSADAARAENVRPGAG
ncbi:hypothetical protein AB0C87_11300 [Actinomadura sp. NPDC048021]|uniref:hypothetical protein n=1 Tax=Actinomadura sp. NPDC048021 TaxID=3155385 RepID=UPI0033FCCDFF